MNIYEFITPSDPITFKADDDKIACICSLVLGNGKDGCTNIETGESLPTMIVFMKDGLEKVTEFLGSDMDTFIAQNKEKISDCFKTFAYGSVAERKTYDDACEAITD